MRRLESLGHVADTWKAFSKGLAAHLEYTDIISARHRSTLKSKIVLGETPGIALSADLFLTSARRISPDQHGCSTAHQNTYYRPPSL